MHPGGYPQAMASLQPGRWKGLLALVLCVHCSLTFVAVLGAALLGGFALPVLFGVRLDYVLVPVGLLGLFAGWLWWGWRSGNTTLREG